MSSVDRCISTGCLCNRTDGTVSTKSKEMIPIVDKVYEDKKKAEIIVALQKRAIFDMRCKSAALKRDHAKKEADDAYDFSLSLANAEYKGISDEDAVYRRNQQVTNRGKAHAKELLELEQEKEKLRVSLDALIARIRSTETVRMFTIPHNEDARRCMDLVAIFFTVVGKTSSSDLEQIVCVAAKNYSQ